MGLKALLLTLTTASRIVHAWHLPNAGHLHITRGSDPEKWMYVNATTDDALPDGSRGVIIKPDLIEGKPGVDGARVQKLKFGPYTLQPGQKREYPIGILGISPFEPGRPLPCNDCYITAMQLNLEYPNGKIANVDTGAWLHHVDISVTGTDYTCPSSIASLIFAGGDPSMWGERIYAGGNERVPVRMNSKDKWGIDPGKGTLGGAVELMSEATKPITVYCTMLFEWVDVTNCAKNSDFKPERGIYQKQSKGFTMKHDGELLFATGHMHDGGVNVELLVNGKVSCNSKQLYANRRGHYTEPTDGTVMKDLVMPAGSHISDVPVCKDWGTVKKGDVLSVKAYFDDVQHMQMKNGKGVLEVQMGLMWTFIGLKS